MSELKFKKKVKIILQTRVRGLGIRGDIKQVAKGYFRNYLNPRNMASLYNEENLNNITSAKYKENTSTNFKALISILDSKPLIIAREASGNGVLYASIKSKDITILLKNEFGIELEKNRIIIQDTIKMLGKYTIKLDLEEKILDTHLFIGRSLEDAKEMIQSSKGHKNNA